MGSQGDVESWYNKGWGLLQQGNYQEAIEAFDKGLSINPNDSKTWSMKGIACMELGKYKVANESYDHVIKFYPNDVDTWVSKATSLYYIGRYEEAVIACEKALALDPDHYMAPEYLQKAKEKMGNK